MGIIIVVIGVSRGTGINSIMRKDSKINTMDNGRLPEWSIGAVLKTDGPKGHESSNPSPSVVHAFVAEWFTHKS